MAFPSVSVGILKFSPLSQESRSLLARSTSSARLQKGLAQMQGTRKPFWTTLGFAARCQEGFYRLVEHRKDPLILGIYIEVILG